MAVHALLRGGTLDTDDIEAYLATIGVVFVVHRGHDSHNTSAGVRVEGHRWFAKWATDTTAVAHLESAVRFHRAVTHPAIVALRSAIRTPSGLAVVHDWADGEVVNDPLVLRGPPARPSDSAFARFRNLPTNQILAAIDTILDAHVAVTDAAFVAVDLYDGCFIYDFDRRTMRLCDLDPAHTCSTPIASTARPASWPPRSSPAGPRLTSAQPSTTSAGLRSFCSAVAAGGRTPDTCGERLTSCSRSPQGVARRNPTDRYQSVRELTEAWRAAAG
jgi:serine/threonine-protein kinase